MMLKLNDGCWVAVEDISEVTINQNYDLATVRMKSGVGHSVTAEHRQSIYTTVDKLITEINRLRTAANSGEANELTSSKV